MSPVRRPRAALLALAAAVVATSLSGCTTGSSSSASRPTPSPSVAADSGTPLAQLDTTTLAVRRTPFCDLVDPAAVKRALGKDPGDASTYRSGQRARVSAHVEDVVHEYGCRWSAGRSSARAWVFVPPVTRAFALGLVRSATHLPGCHRLASAASYGAPSVATSCRQRSAVQVSYAGLFGDAWLTCTLTVPAPGQGDGDLADRAGRWCAAVASGAAAG